MSNSSYLIANDVPGGVADEIGRSGDDGDLLADGPHAVPVFWLALFDEGDLVEMLLEGEDGGTLAVPSLAARLDDACRRFKQRRPLLSARFVEFDEAWQAFDSMLGNLNGRYIKIDLIELWELAAAVDEDLEAEVRDAVRWFESRDEEDFDRLLRIASIQDYDLARRTFPGLGPDVPRTFHLHGHACNDPVWDNSADA